jgi:HD-like signal output (HDOD) protein
LRPDGDRSDEYVRHTLKRLAATGALPTLPAAACAALRVARNPDAGIDQLAATLQNDVGLTARVLRLANSAALGRRAAVTNLQDAALAVGVGRICEILVAACARQLYTISGALAERLWNHSLVVALASDDLAQSTGIAGRDGVFLAGLFHDVGRIALFVAQQMASKSSDPGRERLRVSYDQPPEDFDHSQAGAILTEDWGLSDAQSEAIRWHHEPERAATSAALARLLNAADAIAYRVRYGVESDPPASISTAHLGLSAEDESATADRVLEKFEQQMKLLG